MKRANKSNPNGKSDEVYDPAVNRSDARCALPSLPRWNLTGKLAVIAAGILAAAGITLSLLGYPRAQAQNLGSPAFANPSEVHYRANEKTLRAVIQVTSAKYSIPNVGTETMRQFSGWDPAQPAPAPRTEVGPGPTLRARLGDQVKISFLNKVDDNQFSYTFDTNSKPGQSSFGCDQSTNGYPGNDTFPNCFHGSSTANLHFHGTHTSPDGLGDNVLVQVLPQLKQPDWTASFNAIFAGKIPQKWNDLPLSYRNAQMVLIKQHDDVAAAQAKKNGLKPPDSLWMANQHAIAAGQWPQYIKGAFPNYFNIPDYSSGNYKAGQAPGTHWYHAHKHGSTSLHILNGLAGVFVIESSQEGGYDHFIRKFYGWGNSYGDHEKIIVFQQFDATQNLQRGGPGGKGIKQVLVNGKLTPTITMQPGEVQLWRLVNATEGNNQGIINAQGANGVGPFQTTGFAFKQTAQDGVQFSPANYANQPFIGGAVPNGLKLAGGNRADLLVQAPTASGVTAFKNSSGTILFFVNVAGTAVNQNPAFPATWAELPPFLNDLAAPDPKSNPKPNTLRFQWEAGRSGPGPAGPGIGPHFMINDKQFEQTGEVIDQCMPLDALQDWALENYTTVAHPFHIHINPFQVLKIETPTGKAEYSTYTPKDNFVWQDVIAIPPANVAMDGAVTPGRITIRQTFVDFTGTYVLHCHILAHEDRGMMQLVRVVPAASFPKACQSNVPAHH